jgi:hypothetical protein
MMFARWAEYTHAHYARRAAVAAFAALRSARTKSRVLRTLLLGVRLRASQSGSPGPRPDLAATARGIFTISHSTFSVAAVTRAIATAEDVSKCRAVIACCFAMTVVVRSLPSRFYGALVSLLAGSK